MGLLLTIPAMLALLALSALFSASETALFSLQRETIETWRGSRNRGKSLAAFLLDRQRDVLATLLLGNLIVNTLFYAISALTAYRAVERGEEGLAAGLAVGGLFAVIIFGEVTPKAVALAFNRTVARFVSIPLYLLFVILRPVTRAIGPLVRSGSALVLRAVNPQHGITREELSMLVETTRAQGHIPPHEGEMIEEVMSLAQTRVRDIMTPRVDLVACPKETTVEGLVEIFRRTSRTKVPVYDGDLDHITGIAYVKNALVGDAQALSDVTVPAHFVPELKTAEALLFDFQKSRTTISVVVDEYGGTAGVVTLTDVAGEIVGPLGDEYEAPEALVEEVKPGSFRLAGDLSIRDWEELFSTSVGSEKLSTLGGFVTMLLGRMPRVGDTVTYENVRFTVEDVKRHRVVSVLAEVADEAGAAVGRAGA